MKFRLKGFRGFKNSIQGFLIGCKKRISKKLASNKLEKNNSEIQNNSKNVCFLHQ